MDLENTNTQGVVSHSCCPKDLIIDVGEMAESKSRVGKIQYESKTACGSVSKMITQSSKCGLMTRRYKTQMENLPVI